MTMNMRIWMRTFPSQLEYRIRLILKPGQVCPHKDTFKVLLPFVGLLLYCFHPCCFYRWFCHCHCVFHLESSAICFYCPLGPGLPASKLPSWLLGLSSPSCCHHNFIIIIMWPSCFKIAIRVAIIINMWHSCFRIVIRIAIITQRLSFICSYNHASQPEA